MLSHFHQRWGAPTEKYNGYPRIALDEAFRFNTNPKDLLALKKKAKF
jgi:hypothetical protein